MKPHALVGNVLAPEPIGRAAVVIEEGRISDVVRSPRPDELPRERREVSGFICPGFIDLQINGAFGIDVAPDQETLRALARELPRTGTTSFLPTLVSSPPEVYADFLEALKDASRTSGSRILGAHLEGPFLSPARKGAHDPANLRPVDLGLAKEFLRSGVVRMVTLAPELSDATEAILIFLEGGVIPSAGHTDATYEEMLRAMDSGLCTGTHLYNAMSPFAHRAPGAVGSLLADDRARVGIIVDGVHAHEGALRVAYRQKGPEGLALVTDAMEAAGMPSGEYELGGRKVRLQHGAVRLPDGTLAGSALTMDVAVNNAAVMLHIPLHDAVRMATQTPADILGMPGKGRIVPGADADLVVLGHDGSVEVTIVGGEYAYRREDAI
ncbi:MAG TPA: N-acetylglucosamine-6-phosphate deacetylase [Rubrobacter sp.]|nr:N-acetylglucosamine-6-phosphate deacetylase [Rubrobacter sp.]